MAEWYYLVPKGEVGPISTAQLKKLASIGKISPDTMVRRDRDTGWSLASDVKGLRFCDTKRNPNPDSDRPTQEIEPKQKASIGTPRKRSDQPKPDLASWAFYVFMGFMGVLLLVLVVLQGLTLPSQDPVDKRVREIEEQNRAFRNEQQRAVEKAIIEEAAQQRIRSGK